jgi:hypothetical protein
MRFFAYVLLVASTAAGCGETATSAVSPDGGPDASVDPDGSVDMDGSVPDGSVDGGDPDGGQPDGGTPDGGSWCETSTLCPSCPDPDSLCDPTNPCPVGEECLSTGCEDLSRCFRIGGGTCENDADCCQESELCCAGEICETQEYVCDRTVGRCLRAEPGCSDSVDCVPGFACEQGACVDRRVPCATAGDCPHGYTCFSAAIDQRFCRRITRPCSDDFDCLELSVPCGDADGDGANECMPSLLPILPDPVSCDITQCVEPSAPVCETSPEGVIAVCGRFGSCSSSFQCPDDLECRDLWGDGRAECVEPGGFCLDSSVCDPRSVCASPRSGGAPRCFGGAAM